MGKGKVRTGGMGKDRSGQVRWGWERSGQVGWGRERSWKEVALSDLQRDYPKERSSKMPMLREVPTHE